MSCASWSKLGGGRLRRDCPNWSLAASSAETGAGSRGSGPKRRGAACGWTAPGHGRGGAAACRAAGRAAAGAQSEVLRRRCSCCWRTGRPARLRPHCPPEERVLQHPARATCETVGCAARKVHGAPPLPLPLFTPANVPASPSSAATLDPVQLVLRQQGAELFDAGCAASSSREIACSPARLR